MSKRQIWLTDIECDLVWRALDVLSGELNEDVRLTVNGVEKFGLRWTRDELIRVKEMFAPKITAKDESAR